MIGLQYEPQPGSKPSAAQTALQQAEPPGQDSPDFEKHTVKLRSSPKLGTKSFRKPNIVNNGQDDFKKRQVDRSLPTSSDWAKFLLQT